MRMKTLLKGRVFTFFDVEHMLNPPFAKCPNRKGFFWPSVRYCGNPLGGGFAAIFSPYFPSHRRTLWDRNFSLQYVNFPLAKFPPKKDYFFKLSVWRAVLKRCCGNPLRGKFSKGGFNILQRKISVLKEGEKAKKLHNPLSKEGSSVKEEKRGKPLLDL